MILLLAVILSIAIALARGGSLGRLATVRFRYGWVALLAFALQVVIIYSPLPQSAGILGERALLLLSSYALLIFVVIINRELPGLPIIGLGLALNLLVMLVNGGFMPVTLQALEKAGLSHLALGSGANARVFSAKDIILAREQTHLWMLSDVFIIHWPFAVVFSIGDVLLAIGAFLFFQRTLKPATKGPEATDAFSNRVA